MNMGYEKETKLHLTMLSLTLCRLLATHSFFCGFDNNFAISKIVLDLTEICRFHKKLLGGI